MSVVVRCRWWAFTPVFEIASGTLEAALAGGAPSPRPSPARGEGVLPPCRSAQTSRKQQGRPDFFHALQLSFPLPSWERAQGEGEIALTGSMPVKAISAAQTPKRAAIPALASLGRDDERRVGVLPQSLRRQTQFVSMDMAPGVVGQQLSVSLPGLSRQSMNTDASEVFMDARNKSGHDTEWVGAHQVRFPRRCFNVCLTETRSVSE